MKTFLQTLRRPVRSLFGILLVALAVAVLCVCLGQRFAAEETEKALNSIYLSAAYPDALDEECIQWLNEYAKEHPDVVKLQSHVGIASAYVPELVLDNWTQYIHKTLINDPQTYATYNTAMLEIKLITVENKYEDGTVPGAVCVELIGLVERVIGLQEGYPDPTGYKARLLLRFNNEEELSAMYFCPGDRYLVYGVDYFDLDFVLRNSFAQHLGNMQYSKDVLPYWDLQQLEANYRLYSSRVDSQTGETIYTYWGYDIYGTGYKLETTDIRELTLESVSTRLDYIITHLKKDQVNSFRTVTMTLVNYGSRPWVQFVPDEYGYPVREVVDERSYLDENGETVYITQEEYAQRYQMPTIVRLTGTAEQFLSSVEGAPWVKALNDVQVNAHAFAFVGVDNLRYLENVNSGEIKIIQGREFTEAELSSGARVCLISKQLAEANGLKVGDTINPQFYDPDQSLPYQIEDNSTLPKPLYFFGNTSRLYEAETYTIIGIYEQNTPHPYVVDNPRAFTCNTIFVPKTALHTAMQQGDSLAFQTVVIHNGKLVEFLLDAVDAGYGRAFHASDSGYSTVSGSLESYQENARRALTVGLTVYGMILLLYLLLFPTQQKKNLSVMKAMGAGRLRQIGHVFGESLLILTLGTLIGGAAGMLMWDGVVNMLTGGSSYALNIVLPSDTFVRISLAQLALAAVLLLGMSVVVTHGKAMQKRS